MILAIQSDGIEEKSFNEDGRKENGTCDIVAGRREHLTINFRISVRKSVVIFVPIIQRWFF